MRNLALILATTALLLPGLARSADAADEGKAWLGVALAQRVEVHDGEVTKEVKILEVFDGSPAEKAGLQKGDVILEVDGTEAANSQEIAERLGSLRPGQKVGLLVLRDGEEMRVRTRLGERPEDYENQLHAPHAEKIECEKLLRHGGGEEFTWHGMPGAQKRMRIYTAGGGPRIGVRIETLTEQLAGFFGVDGGVLVSEVIAGTPAQKAGLLAGDVVTAAGGKPILGAADLQKAIRENGSDSPIRIEVMRRGERLTFDTTPEGKEERHSSCCGEEQKECCPHGTGAKAIFLGEQGQYHKALEEALKQLEGVEIDVEAIHETAEKALQQALGARGAGEADVQVMKQIRLSPGETI